jgi:outer membrane immunogenic protein
MGGGQAGYNYQFANSWVVGIEADIQGIAGAHSSASFASSLANPNFPDFPLNETAIVSKSIDYLGTVRGRFGYLLTPTLLIFGDGGLAYGGVNSSTSIIQTGTGLFFLGVPSSFGKISNTQVGWSAGAGFEWLFLPNWSVKAEYLYCDLGNVSHISSPILAFNAPPFVPGLFMSSFPQTTTRFNGSVVRAGLNYHFNWGAAPVVAKYGPCHQGNYFRENANPAPRPGFVAFLTSNMAFPPPFRCVFATVNKITQCMIQL